MDSEININLNDASVQDFDASGRLLSENGTPRLDPEELNAYQQIVETFERHIERSEEQERERSGATRPEGAEQPRVTVVTDPLDDATFWGDERSGGSPPDDVLDAIVEDDPIVPPGDGNGGGGGGGGWGGLGAGAGFLFGPQIGAAVMVFGDVLDGVIAAFEGLVEVIEAVDDSMQSLVEDTKPFSVDVASADANRQITDLLIRMDRAETIGPDLARWIETRTEIDAVMGKIATDVSQTLIPLVQEGTEVLLDILTAISMISSSGEEIKDVVASGIRGLIGLGPLGDEIIERLGVVATVARAGLKGYRQQRMQKLMDTDQIARQFEAFFTNNMAQIVDDFETRNVVGGFQ